MSAQLRAVRAEWRAKDFGLEESPFGDIAGGDVAANLATAEALASGGGPRRT